MARHTCRERVQDHTHETPIQTRQPMENEVLALWAAKEKAVLFITHDLDEAHRDERPGGVPERR